MKSSPSPSAVKLSEPLLTRLNVYALAASAAGVGLLALAPPADAKIVYRKAHKAIAPNNTVPFDINGDHRTDFSFHASFTCTSFCEYIVGAITVEPVRSANQVWGFAGRSRVYASALSAGVLVGAKGKFTPGNKVMAFGGYDAGTTSVGYCGGPWDNARQRYLGLKFTISGKVHFGWARLDDTCEKNGKNTALLTGYAYETVPNKAIRTGKTANGSAGEAGSIGHLAAGSSRISAH